MAFLPTSPLPHIPSRPVATRTPRCGLSQPPPQISRRALLLSAVALSALRARPATASSAGVESAISRLLFPKSGFNAPSSPIQSSVIDRDYLNTKPAKSALATLRAFNATLRDLSDKFSASPQLPLTASLKELSIAQLRAALNVVNEAVDEETQLKTDKLVRGIIQDIGQLNTAAALKNGAVRTPRKIDRTMHWFSKITSDFDSLLAYYQ